MDTTTLLIIIVVVLLLFGGGWYGGDVGTNSVIGAAGIINSAGRFPFFP